jgi:hypothetical protein
MMPRPAERISGLPTRGASEPCTNAGARVPAAVGFPRVRHGRPFLGHLAPPPCAVVWRRAQAPAAVAQGLTSSVPHRDDRSVRAETDTMWWLSFLGGGVVIMEAASLAQARLIAVVNGFGRASQFVEGYPIDAQLAAGE